MRQTAIGLLQAFLWLICAFHVIVGVGINWSPEFARQMAQYYGARVEWTPQFVYMLKPLGAFMFILGALAAAAARDPLRYPVIVYGFVMLFTIRALQRLVHQREIFEAFAIAPGRNLGAMVLFFVMAASLFTLYRHVARNARGAGR